MDPLADLSWVARLLRRMAALAWWVVTTAWLGLVIVIRTTRLLWRIPDYFATTLPCARGHAVPMFGVFDCRCGAIHEGWAFGRCSVCGESAGWAPCDTCGLPVRNPLRW